MLEQLIRDAYDQMAATDQPPARVSIQQAILQARARLRRRRLSTFGTPVLAAGAVLAVILTEAIPASHPGSQTRQRTPSAAGPLTVRSAPAHFNPLVPYAAFGWLPAGETAGAGSAGRTVDTLNAGHGHPSWQLSVYARAQCTLQQGILACASGMKVRVHRAPAVAGHRAYWSGMYLAWQYARGGWAVLNTQRKHKKPTPAYGEVASHVTFGTSAQPIEFPVQLTNVPRAWRVSSVSYQHRAGTMLAEAFSVTKGDGILQAGAETANLPGLSVAPAGNNGCYFYPGGQSRHRVLKGYRVVVSVIPAARGNPPSYQVCARNAAGLWIFVGVNGWHPVISPVNLFRHLRILGTSPSNLITQPIAG